MLVILVDDSCIVLAFPGINCKITGDFWSRELIPMLILRLLQLKLVHMVCLSSGKIKDC